MAKEYWKNMTPEQKRKEIIARIIWCCLFVGVPTALACLWGVKRIDNVPVNQNVKDTLSDKYKNIVDLNKNCITQSHTKGIGR